MTIVDFLGNATTSAVIGGLTAWLATYRLNRSFARQENQDELADLLAEIQAEGSTYWNKCGLDSELERVIIKLSMRCRKKCLRYDKRFLGGKHTAGIKARAQTLHNALTDGSFQMSTRVSELDRIDRIKKCIDQLESEIDI